MTNKLCSLRRSYEQTSCFFFASLFAFVIFSSFAEACDLCAIYSATNASGLDGQGFRSGVAEQFTHYGTLKIAGQTVANPVGQYLNSSITQIFSNYDFNNRFGIQLTLPLIVRSFKRAREGAAETGTESGIGDISLIGRFLPYQKYTEHFSLNGHLLGGIKFPAGSTNRLQEELVEGVEDPNLPQSGIHGHDLTLGSGSVDGIMGTDLYMRWHRFLTTADLQYSIRSTGSIRYRFANDLHWHVGTGAYLLLHHTATLALQARVSGEHKGLDTLAGVQADDTGITSVFMGPDFIFTWKQHLSANLGADIPLLIHNTAFQSVPDYRIRTAINWRF